MAAVLPRILLKPNREGPFLSGHPWVFAGAVGREPAGLAPGAEVLLCDAGDRFTARGLYNPLSQIRVRLYTRSEKQPLDDLFFQKRIEKSIALRQRLGLLQDAEAGCRLVFSESDGLSGLTIDRYGPYLAVQITSLALMSRVDSLIKAAADIIKPKGIMLRTEKGIRDLEGLEAKDGLFQGVLPEGPVRLRENGLFFDVNLREGQKTGYYLDQRDNRKRAAEFASGRKCLDVCCYTGGFTLNLLKQGAASVLGIDASGPSLELARQNMEQNGLSGATFVKADAFAELERLLDTPERFDLIVLDPPRFAHSGKGVNQALKGYAGLNGLAVRLLAENGLLVTCSCSGRVTRDDFRGMLWEVSQDSGRAIRILEERGAAVDHPVSIDCPESEYLKCFICEVE